MKNFAGWSIFFEYDEATDSSHAQLQPRNPQSIRIVRGENGDPWFLKSISLKGIVSESILLGLLNPADQNNINGKEQTYVVGNPGVLIGIEDNGRHGDFRALLENFLLPESGGWDGVLPLIQLASKNKYFERAGVPPFGSIPNLDALLSQPGNDPRNIETINSILTRDLADVVSLKNVSTALIGDGYYFPIDTGLQKMLLPLSFAAK